MKTHIPILFLLIIMSSVGYSQYQFSDYRNSTVLLPSYAGFEGTKFTTKYRDQFPAIPGNYTTIQATAEHQLTSFNSGVGLQYLRYNESALSVNNIEVLYSYDFKINDNFHIRPGAQFCFSFISLNAQELVWRDQLKSDGTITSTSYYSGQIDYDKAVYPDAGASVLFYTNNLWFAIGANHLLLPRQAFSVITDSRLSIQFIGNGGYIFHSKTNPDEAIIIDALYKNFGGGNQFNIGATWHNKFLIGGLSYRCVSISEFGVNNDAIIALVGFKFAGFSIKYSYDFVISGLIGTTGGSHEITLSYLCCRKKDIPETIEEL